jgi:hypothetical protein
VVRAAALQMSFVDVELLRQDVRLEPQLQAIPDFLDQRHVLIERVRRDLVRGLKKADLGRRVLTAPQVPRWLLLMRLKNWDYRELGERIADGLTLRASGSSDPGPHLPRQHAQRRQAPQPVRAIDRSHTQEPAPAKAGGKAGKPNEFGKMVKLQEAEKQIITDYEVYARRPNDADLLVAAIETHQALLRRAPHLVAADAAFFSAKNEAAAKAKGVKRVCIPNRSTKSPERKREQKKRWFRNAQKWRTGCEGRISVAKRRHGLDRCRYNTTASSEFAMASRWPGKPPVTIALTNPRRPPRNPRRPPRRVLRCRARSSTMLPTSSRESS